MALDYHDLNALERSEAYPMGRMRPIASDPSFNVLGRTLGDAGKANTLLGMKKSASNVSISDLARQRLSTCEPHKVVELTLDVVHKTIIEEEEDMHVPKCELEWLSKVIALNLLWTVASSSVVIIMKRVVSKVDGEEALFPYSFSFTSMNQPVAGLLAFCLSKLVLDRDKPPLPKLTWGEFAKWVGYAFMAGLEIGLGNKAMQFLDVSAAQMLKSLSVLFVMLSAFCWGMEALGLLRILSAMLLVAGAAMQTAGQTSGEQTEEFRNWAIGAGMIIFSLILSGQRWVLAQWIFRVERRKGSALGQMSKAQLLARVLPVTAFVTLPLAAIFETEAFVDDALLDIWLYLDVFMVAAGIAALLYAEFNLVHRLSAVGFNVNAAIHQIPIVFSGVIINHNDISRNALFGFSLCLAGALVYTAARYWEAKS